QSGDGALTMLDLLAGGQDALDGARATVEQAATGGAERLQLSTVKLLPPVPHPPKIICVGRNYAAHAREAGREPSEFPILFSRFAATLLADGEPVLRPFVSEQLDWEGELAVVIGRGGRHIQRDVALEHVAGYSAFNDVTVRDYQFRTTQYLAGKNFSASAPFGPCLATRDELPDPQALEVRTFIDDEQVQYGRTEDMLFNVATIIAHLSEFVELEPGDVIATGTPSGVGFTRKPPRFLTPGQTVRVEVTGVGSLSNPVADEQRPGAQP
ncbi:MAG: fumarylacetoacetate hydrolase family protein, partial [Solirubrobacteraceae bacterium]